MIVVRNAHNANKLDFEGAKEIEVGDGTIASAGSNLGIGVWSSISGRLVGCPPFHSRLAIAGDRKPIGQAIVA